MNVAGPQDSEAEVLASSNSGLQLGVATVGPD